LLCKILCEIFLNFSIFLFAIGINSIKKLFELSKYIGVALASSIKFVGGPLAGAALGMHWMLTAILSTIGMMVTVVLILYAKQFFDKLMGLFSKNKPRKKFSKLTRYSVRIKNRLGLWGVALLTPFLFTPILGTFLALAFKYNKREIFLKMLVSGFLGGVVQSAFFFYIKLLIP
jgi:hypothetical protein